MKDMSEIDLRYKPKTKKQAHDYFSAKVFKKSRMKKIKENKEYESEKASKIAKSRRTAKARQSNSMSKLHANDRLEWIKKKYESRLRKIKETVTYMNKIWNAFNDNAVFYSKNENIIEPKEVI